MPPKRTRKVPAGTIYIQGQNGEGFFGDVWRGVKSVGNKVNNFARNTGAVSKGLALIGRPGAAALAKQAGYGQKGGRRRRRPAARRGRGQSGGASGLVRF